MTAVSHGLPSPKNQLELFLPAEPLLTLVGKIPLSGLVTWRVGKDA